jgi:hypothetical protein
MGTTCGSFALKGAKASKDAVITQRLQKAGFLIIGKANLSVSANWIFSLFELADSRRNGPISSKHSWWRAGQLSVDRYNRVPQTTKTELKSEICRLNRRTLGEA